MDAPLLQRSEQQRESFFTRYGPLLETLADRQEPEALFVACADSRVTPEQLFGLQPGQWFMHRNVGNLIPPYSQTEICVASTLEFALMELRVRHIIVCGHTDCGAIKGLETGVDMTRQPGLARWLELGRPALDEVAQGVAYPEVSRHYALVERNVVQQLRHLQSYPLVRTLLAKGALELHGWVYYLTEQAVGYYLPQEDLFLR